MTHTRREDLVPVDPPLPRVRLIALETREADAPGTGTSGSVERGADASGADASRADTSGVAVGRDCEHLRTLEAPATDPGRVCVSILQVAGEAMRGLRPLVQLSRWVGADIFAELAEYAPAHGARTSVRQRLCPEATATVLARARVLRVRVARISPHVAECTVLIQLGERVRAVVVRLEARGSTWRATTLCTV
ncbi:MAG: Rv3235 family protein [Actinomycetota bacterium]|nr:Rv3235 family protein [Actinomycetota bacterium]